MKYFSYYLLVSLMFWLPGNGWAGTKVVEGDAAKSAYEAEKATSKILAQKDKTFILKEPGGTETVKPKTVALKVNEKLFITNEEEKFVHNVYDTTDSSWVLKKQKPSEVAIISFDAPGEHKLKCAIHPKMKIKVIVE